MARADGWFMCRVGFLETARAVSLAGSPSAVRALQAEWPAFGVIEVDQALVERAIELALAHDLRSLDALHLAAALVLPREDLTVAVWDRRLHAAARAESLGLFPETFE
jgi:predicted nucleic acid-binding protein